MPEITGVRERRNRAWVSVDGEFWAELDAAVVIESGLREGAEFSPEELDRVRIAGEKPVAMGRALNLLGYRARSEAEIRDRLTRYGYVEGTIEGVVLRLQVPHRATMKRGVTPARRPGRPRPRARRAPAR